MITTFTTDSGSTYELDRAGSRIRRLAGSHAPTHRQGPDHEWKSFEFAPDLEIGKSLVVCWRVVNGIHQCLITSPVSSVNPGNVTDSTTDSTAD